MSGIERESRRPTVVDRFRSVVRGADDARVRATWRVLLAWPLLWILTGGVLAANVQSAVEVVPSGRGPAAGLAQSVLHGGFFTVALVAWARYLDRRPLSDYGISPSLRWVRGLLVGFVAVVAGFCAWVALGAALGRTTVELSASYPEGSLPVALAVLLVAVVIHAAIQQVVFFRVVLGTAAEGLASRGVAPSRTVVGALLVSILSFISMHGLPLGLRFLDLAVAGTIFGLLYVRTGELALGVGAHLGALYGGSVLFASAGTATDGPVVFEVTGSLPGFLGVLGGYGFPKMVVAYLLLVAWLRWQGRARPVQWSDGRADRR